MKLGAGTTNSMIKKVAIVEDDRGLRDQLAQILGASRDVRFVGACASGEEALDRIHVLQPDVVLMDIKLPGLDGLEVLRRVRADPRTRLAPVVVLTTSTEHRDIVESYGRGANGFVRKPVDFEEFSRAIDALGVYWLVVNRPPPPL